MIDFAKLSAPFPPDQVSWRVGATKQDKTAGLALAYIDARDVQDRLDAVCTPAGWQCRYTPMHDKKTVCEIGIKIGDEWIWKADGAGDTDVEAEKGSLSDAFKRAAVRWGVGRYLYDVKSAWVEIEKAGNSYKIKDGEYNKLRALLGGKNAAPATASKPALTPEQYADQCKQRIAQIKTMDDAKRFREANYKGLDKLDQDKPELFEEVTKALHAKEATFKKETV